MDKYTVEITDSIYNIVRLDGNSLSGKELISNIEKLQAVAEAAKEYINVHKRASQGMFSKNAILKAREEMQSALANLQPKTIQQLQDERNAAADALSHYTSTFRESSSIVDEYEAAKQAHEAALAKQTGE